MGRKVITFWLSFTMVFSFIVVLDVIIDFTPSVKGDIIRYVNETGSGGSYTKIQDAINASNDGDTVFVYIGIYYENVVVNRTINLIGEDRENTVVNGSGAGTVILISSDWVNVTGFKVTGSGPGTWYSGITIDSANNCSILNNTITYNYEGFCLFSASDNLIEGNIVSFNDHNGIILQNSHSNIITQNNATNNDRNIILFQSNGSIITQNNISNAWDGVYIEQSNNINITDNIAFSNYYSGIYLIQSYDCSITVNNLLDNSNYGLIIELSNYSNILSNYISGSEVGILSQDSNNITISGNILPIINKTVIVLSSSSYNIVSNNIISSVDGGSYGLYISHSDKNRIFNNSISNNHWGIRVKKSVYNNISKNNIWNNSEGIYLEDSSNNTIGYNEISNYWEGINFHYSSSYNKVFYNNITFNRYGIYIEEESNYNSISYNNISLNNRHGIYQDNSFSNNISFNNISSNKQSGIYSKSFGNCIFHKNHIYYNGEFGIFLGYNSYYEPTYQIIISENVISLNDNNGIHIDHCSNITIINNIISQNAKIGVYLGQLENGTIKNNVLTEDGIFITGGNMKNWVSHKFENNLANGKPIYYYKNMDDVIVPDDAASVILANCSDFIIQGIDFDNVDVAIEMGYSSNNQISDNQISSNDGYGMTCCINSPISLHNDP